MEKISNTNNYYLSIDGINHTPIMLNSFQHENIKLTNLYCLLMFTSQFNNRKALLRYLKDLELIPEDYVGDYIAIVDRHTTKDKKVYYEDTHLRIFYQREIGYFNEEIIADFITKNLGNPMFDEIFYEKFGKRERDPITNQARKLADIIREKQSKLDYYRKEKKKALSKENEKVYKKKAGEPSGFSKEEIQKRMSELNWEIESLTNERSLLHFMYMFSQRRKKTVLTEKEEAAFYAGVINFVRTKTRREGYSANSKYDYKGFIRLTNFVLDTIRDSNTGNLGFYIPNPSEEKTETYLEIEKALNSGNIFNIVNSKKHEKKYYDLEYLFGEATDDSKELYKMFSNIDKVARYSRNIEYRKKTNEIVHLLKKVNETHAKEKREYIKAYNYLLKEVLKHDKMDLIISMNLINRYNGFELKEDRSDKMPSSFKDMSPDEIAFSGPLNKEEVEYKERFEYDEYNFEERDNNEPDFPYLDKDYYQKIINNKDIPAIIFLFNELKRRTNDVQFRNNIDQFLNIIRNASKDKSRKFYSTEINNYYDEYVRLFNKKWGEIRDIFDDINEEYGLEKPKSY